MKLTVGIVGLPNAGKSTLFNALLKKQSALAANYPFATIEPNMGIVPVHDKRLGVLASVVENELGKKPPIVPATIGFVDIAGLVEGAHKGEGLGNQFLSHIREVDVICHVVRYFDDADVIHTSGSVDPKRDIAIIETELALADLQTLENSREERSDSARQKIQKQDLIEKIKNGLNNNVPARRTISSHEEKGNVQELHLLTAKPALYVLNVSEEQLSTTKTPKSLSSSMIITAKTEAEVVGLHPEDQKEYLASIGIDKTGLDTLISKCYGLLGLISFLTMGEIEVRAWTVRSGTSAPKSAGTIHTDFEKNFIKAEVISFNDLEKIGSEKKAKELGKVRLEGKDYIMQDGDVAEFKIGA